MNTMVWAMIIIAGAGSDTTVNAQLLYPTREICESAATAVRKEHIFDGGHQRPSLGAFCIPTLPRNN